MRSASRSASRCGADQVGQLAALGDLALAGGEGLLLGLDRLGAHGFGSGDRGRALLRLLGDVDRLLDLGDLDLLVAVDAELAQVAVLDQPRFLDAALGGDAGPLDLFAGRDLGLLEGLALGDLQRFEMPLALEPDLVERALLRDPRGLGLPGSATISARRFSASALVTSSAFSASAIWRSSSASFERASCARSPARSARARARCGPFSSESSSAICSRSVSSRIFISALVERAAARDLAALRLFLAADALLGDVALLGEPRLLDRLARRRAAPARLPGRAPRARLASSARCAARRISTSRSCSSRAYSLSRSISSTLRWVSRFWLRMSTSVRCSISLRIRRRVSIDLGQLRQAFGVEGVGRVEDIRGWSGRGRRWRRFPARARWRRATPRPASRTLAA